MAQSTEAEVADAQDCEPDERPGWRRDAAVLLSSQAISLLGSSLVQYAISWYLMLETRSGLVVALTLIAGFLPQAIVSVFGGVWADRVDRKRLVIAADAAIAASTLVLALLLLAGVNELWPFFLILAIRSAGTGFHMPAAAALVPQIVPASRLMRVNGLMGSIQSAIYLVAPAGAGVLYAVAPMGAILMIDVATAAIGIAMLAGLAVPALPRLGERPGYLRDLADGVRYVATHRVVRWLLTTYGALFLLAVAPSFLMPLMLVRTFGDEVWKLTVNETLYCVGLIVGGLVIAAWGGVRNRVLMILGSFAVWGVLSLAMGFTTNLWVFFALYLALGILSPFFSTPTTTFLQEQVEPDRQGRVFGFLGFAVSLTTPVGIALFGPVADVLGVESMLVVSGILTLLVVAIALSLPTGRAALRRS
jgi:DHA3 family macrolide efflux protein-like MFS transporter